MHVASSLPGRLVALYATELPNPPKQKSKPRIFRARGIGVPSKKHTNPTLAKTMAAMVRLRSDPRFVIGLSPRVVDGSSILADKPDFWRRSDRFTGLSPNTTYYVRAYATNEAGTSYGSASLVSAGRNAANLLYAVVIF